MVFLIIVSQVAERQLLNLVAASHYFILGIRGRVLLGPTVVDSLCYPTCFIWYFRFRFLVPRASGFVSWYFGRVACQSLYLPWTRRCWTNFPKIALLLVVSWKHVYDAGSDMGWFCVSPWKISHEVSSRAHHVPCALVGMVCSRVRVVGWAQIHRVPGWRVVRIKYRGQVKWPPHDLPFNIVCNLP